MREHRRALDRAEHRVLEWEQKLLTEMMKHGSANYEMVITLAGAYVDRARERQARGRATPEDYRILARYDNGRRRSTDEPDKS